LFAAASPERKTVQTFTPQLQIEKVGTPRVLSRDGLKPSGRADETAIINQPVALIDPITSNEATEYSPGLFLGHHPLQSQQLLRHYGSGFVNHLIL